MALKDILGTVYRRLGITDPPPNVVTRVRGDINEGHRTILSSKGLASLKNRSIHFSSVASQKVYGFPVAFERINRVTDQTHDLPLDQYDMDFFRAIDPGERSEGTPSGYVLEGWRPRFRVPAVTGTGIWVDSTNINDTEQSVTFRGVRLNGDPGDLVTVTLNGTTRVAIDSANTDYIDILSWDISSPALGVVRLYDSALAGGNELSRIPVGQTSVQYWCLRLWPTPSDVSSYVVDGVVEVFDLIENEAEPLLPPSFHDLLAMYARLCEYERTRDVVRLDRLRKDYDQRLGQLNKFVNFPPDYQPVAGQKSGRSGWSSFGAWYPADRFR